MTWGAATPPWSNLLSTSSTQCCRCAHRTAALALTGCGGSSGSGTATAAARPPSAVTNRDQPGRPRQARPDGGDLRWALGQIPANFNYNQLDGTLLDNAQVVTALLPAPFDFDADGTAGPEQGLLHQDRGDDATARRRSPTTSTRRRSGPTASRSPPPTSMAQWKATERHQQGLQRSPRPPATTRSRRSSRGSSDQRGRRHLQEPLRRLAGAVQPAVPGVDQQRPERLQRRAGSTKPLHDRRSVQVRQRSTRPPRRSRWSREPEVVGRQAEARPDHLPRHRPRRADRRARQRRDRLHRRRPRRRTSIQARRGHRRRGDPPRRRAELPAHHVQRHRRRPAATSTSARRIAMAIDRQTIADAMLGPLGGDVQDAGQPHLHAEPDRLPGQRWRPVQARRRRRANDQLQTRPAGRRTATPARAPRTASRSRSAS